MLADGGTVQGPASSERAHAEILCTAEVPWTNTSPVKQLIADLGSTPFSLVTLFVTPLADFASVVAEAERCFPDTDVVACTTAGEIGSNGYDEGLIVAIGFPKSGFFPSTLLIENIHNLNAQPVIDRIALERLSLQDRDLDMEHSFAFLVVDGLSLSEDTLAATISPALRDMQVFGGSAGDGIDFGETLVALNGKIMTNAAVLTMMRCKHKARVFSLDHLIPTEEQMVVTEADPDRRIVKSINAEPAAREYARIIGKDPEQLDRFTFASHPVVVRIGDTHHVRAILQVNDADELIFFSAIDEGMVLTVANPDNMAEHLTRVMAELSEESPPANIIGCDCLFRRVEAEQVQMGRELSDIMVKHRVTGFSTYGEQIGPLHVNHTMSGVAFYHSDTADE
jgi:hypothetical protein